jgi:hypothetical protein
VLSISVQFPKLDVAGSIPSPVGGSPPFATYEAFFDILDAEYPTLA